MKSLGYIIGFTIVAVVAFILLPISTLFVGWLIGFSVEIILGDTPSHWLNTVAGTSRFERGDFAIMSALITLMGLLFNAVRISGKRSD